MAATPNIVRFPANPPKAVVIVAVADAIAAGAILHANSNAGYPMTVGPHLAAVPGFERFSAYLDRPGSPEEYKEREAWYVAEWFVERTGRGNAMKALRKHQEAQ